MLLPAPGSVLAHEGYGVPLLLTRGKDGQIRAFLNACQHKGAKLVEDCEPHKMSRLTCPYHGWEFGADGLCSKIPSLDSQAKFPGRAATATGLFRSVF